MSFGEDRSRVRKDHADANMAALRRLALGLLKNEMTKKVRIKNKLLIAAWNIDLSAASAIRCIGYGAIALATTSIRYGHSPRSCSPPVLHDWRTGPKKQQGISSAIC
jgi:hypothetical protein